MAFESEYPSYDARNTAPNTAASPSTKAPPKADAARNKILITGLADALNRFQAEISGPGDDKPQLYPDTYSIVIVDDVLQQAKVIPPGATNLKQVPMVQAQTANQAKNPATQKVDNNAKTTKVIAGTSIVQFLDQVIRTSSYIYDQQIALYDAKSKRLVPNGTPADTVGWYRIGLQAVPQTDKFDTKRNDYAYDITYQINIYAVSDVKSDFFPAPKYRGAQKIYNYWFTGENTQILDFSQDFNYLYYIVSNGPRPERTVTSDIREVERRYFQVNSPESSQGQDDDKVNEPSANAADYLYSPGDQARVRLKLIGDPAWIFQGETWAGIAGQNLLYDAFLPDGTINIEGQEVLFRLQWNNPVDYDLETGIADPTGKNYYKTASSAGEPRQNYVYKAIQCTSTFNQGKFEQELNGVLMIYPLPKKSDSDSQRQSANSAFSAGPDQSDAETRRLQAAANRARLLSSTPTTATQNTDAPGTSYGDTTNAATTGPQTPAPLTVSAPTSGSAVIGPATAVPAVTPPTPQPPQNGAKEY